MGSSKYLRFLTLTLSYLPLCTPQLTSLLPSCIVECIDNSPDTNCSLFDIPCLCRASAGNFLTDTVTCMHAQCDNTLNTNILLSPLQLACQLAGSPIPDSAVRNAQIVASQLEQVVTTTVTASASPSSTARIPTNVQATTTKVQSWRTSTVSQTTTREGNVIESVIPVIVGQGTTKWGSGSVVSSFSTSASGSRNGGVVSFTTTNSAGSPFVTTSSSLTGTSSSQSTVSSVANGLSTVSGSLSNPPPTATSPVALSTSTTSSSNAVSTSSSRPDDTESNSAPFRNTNAGARNTDLRSSFAMSIAIVGLCLWL